MVCCVTAIGAPAVLKGILDDIQKGSVANVLWSQSFWHSNYSLSAHRVLDPVTKVQKLCKCGLNSLHRDNLSISTLQQIFNEWHRVRFMAQFWLVHTLVYILMVGKEKYKECYVVLPAHNIAKLHLLIFQKGSCVWEEPTLKNQFSPNFQLKRAKLETRKLLGKIPLPAS